MGLCNLQRFLTLAEITAPGRSGCHCSAMRLAMLPVGNEWDQGSGKEKGDVWVQKNVEQKGACADTSNRIAFGDGELLFKIHTGTKWQSCKKPKKRQLTHVYLTLNFNPPVL